MKPIVLALTLILIAAVPLSSQPEGHGKNALRKAMNELNLTDEQKDALGDIRTATKKEMIDIRAGIQKKRIELKEVTRDDQPNRAMFERISRELADLQVQQKLLLFDSQQKMLQQLDADQQEVFKKLQKYRKSAMRNSRPGHRGRPHDAMDR